MQISEGQKREATLEVNKQSFDKHVKELAWHLGFSVFWIKTQ